ncbi:DJ-1/PfpI family protein [bacterium]|nr:DJ-1/PfpI family protein [bacterium]MCI0605388.1 DJ-1/PfpI family protein [bacterium]
MTKRLNTGILLFPDVEVLDFAGPFEVFSRTRITPGIESRRSNDSAPFQVFTVAKSTSKIIATGGLGVLPDYSFSDHPKIDLLVVPGGFGTRSLLSDQETLEWIRNVSSSATLTTSVCTGALLLTKAGLLNGMEATTHWGAIELMQSINQAGQHNITVLNDRRFVDSGNIMTSAGVSAGIDMALHIVEQMFGKAVADETATYIEYRRQVP